MEKRYTCDQRLEVIGVAVLSFVRNMGTDAFDALILKHGFDTVDVDAWYPAQRVFDLFNDVVDSSSGNTQIFVAMGMQIAEQSQFPPEMAESLTLAMILEGWQIHYQANHRGADLPPVETVKVSDTHYQLVLSPDNLYPADLVYGMAYGFCKLLLPPETYFSVSYDDEYSPYNDPHGQVIVHISWE